MQTKKLTVHRPSKKLFTTDKDFGHYLAGIIDADGHFSKLGHVVIAFNLRDIRDAYTIRSLIGYGKVRPVKGKNSVNLIISNKKGASHVANLVRHKLKHPDKIEQYNLRLCELLGLSLEKTSIDTTIDWDSFWFSGFCDADGHLRIHILNRPHRKNHEVRLLCQIDQKGDVLLKQMQLRFGGYLGYRKPLDTYYYSSVSFKGIYSILQYFDKYSSQYTQAYLRYTILRKSYLIIQKKEHLTPKGLDQIVKYRLALKDMI